MSPQREITVRAVQVKDFQFIRDLAANQPNFTIPPSYVLWLLLRIKGDVCLLAEDRSGQRLAYLLAVPIEAPANSLYVWQLAGVDQPDMEGVIHEVLRELDKSAKTQGIKSLIFSAIPTSPSFRKIRLYIARIWNTEPGHVRTLPDIIAPDETEFQVDL